MLVNDFEKMVGDFIVINNWSHVMCDDMLTIIKYTQATNNSHILPSNTSAASFSEDVVVPRIHPKLHFHRASAVLHVEFGESSLLVHIQNACDNFDLIFCLLMSC
jgi:hypothetical protein